MDSGATEVEFEYLPFFRAYKDGRVERFFGTDRVPPSVDPQTGFSCKDVLISPETAVLARLFRQSAAASGGRKLPLLVYFHGGAFCFGSPFCFTYHNHITSLAAEANCVALSVDYRLAPEHPLPAAYEDSWAALQWVASHRDGQGPEEWLNEGVDFRRVFVAGDSAGGNIAHNVMARAGVEGLAGLEIAGSCLVHPYFAGREGGLGKGWAFVCPASDGAGDPRINPSIDPNIRSLGGKRVLVCVAEKDVLRDRGWFYYETLNGSGWAGLVEIFETPGKEHVFHLFETGGEKSVALVKKLASFINQE